MKLTTDLRAEYDRLWKKMLVRSDRATSTDQVVSRMLRDRPRYEVVAKITHVPWFVIAVIHSLEGSGQFNTHLHNGDSLKARTKNKPKGRPLGGKPPFSWEDSAVDALQCDGLAGWKDWSIAGILFKLEGYNGWGYREHHPTVLSAYLWSFSTLYTIGKFVSDGTWDGHAVSGQVGAAVLLRRLVDRGIIQIGGPS